MNRSTTFDLILPDEFKDKYQKIINSIRENRAIHRQVYSAYAMNEMSLQKIIEKDGKRIVVPGEKHFPFTWIMNKGEINRLLRKEFSTTFLSFVLDSISREVEARWKAKDPKVPATRGYLCLQGARDIAFFNHIGIACPQATARPKLFEHKISIKWDHEIGEITFGIGKLDGARYGIWKSLRDSADDWSIGTVYINERDGRLLLGVSYTCPDRAKELDVDKKMYVEFSDNFDNYILCYTDDKWEGRPISARGAIEYLFEMEQIYKKYALQLAAYDRRLEKKHRGTIRERIHRYTVRREGGVKDHNHIWTRRITEFAQQKCAGEIIVINLPVETLADYPWRWYQFKTFLSYKIKEIGGNVKFVDIDNKEKVAA